MKKIFTLLLCGLTVALASCDKTDEGSDAKEIKFAIPAVSAVGDTSAGVSCEVLAGAELLGMFETGFAYGVGNDTSKYTYLPVTTFEGTKLVGTLSGLTAGTSYQIFAYAKVGDYIIPGSVGSFKTSGEGGGGGGDEPVVPPADANTRYSGWAELASEISKPGDYYYAYHLCPDVSMGGHKARNYTVCYSNALKCAIWVAAPMHSAYAVPNCDRTNAYKTDPDIATSQPCKWNGYTRGHMLGSAERLVSEQTNRQVFYHSNIAPQLGQPYFNTGGGAWNTIEDWVNTQWVNSSDTTYQVIGCYWANKNKKVSGTTIPTHFYKVLLRTKGHKNKWVVNCSRDELQCIAIMVEHRTYSKNEVAKPSEYESRGMLYTVKQMEEMTGLKFFANVANAPKDAYNVSDWGL